MAEEFEFKKFYQLDAKYINLADTNLIKQSVIVPIQKNERAKKFETLLYKNNLQHKILNYQFDKLLIIYQNMTTNKDLTKKQLETAKELNCSNIKNIRKYSDLDSLSKLEKNVTPIESLIMITLFQACIIDHQYDDLVSRFEKHIAGLDPINSPKTKTKKTKKTKKRLVDIMIDSLYYMTQMKIVLKDEIIKEQPSVVRNDCCVCFENMQTRICLVPCGHTVVCGQCAANINKCPICVTTITQFVRIYD